MRASSQGVAVVLVVVAEPVVRVALVEPGDQVAPAELVELVEPDDQVVPAEPAALAELDDQVVPAEPVVLAELDDQAVPAELAVSEELENQVELAELEIDQAPVLALAIVRAVAPARVIVLVRGIVQAAAVPERDRAAAPLKIRLATEPHRRDRVEVLKVADLAAVAETTRERAATAGARAWAAAE
jgi:hypothetical protein